MTDDYLVDNLLPVIAVRTWLTASKKKNLDAVDVLTNMTTLAAMTARRPTMFIQRMTLRITKPGPASDCGESAILVEAWLVLDLAMLNLEVMFVM